MGPGFLFAGIGRERRGKRDQCCPGIKKSGYQKPGGRLFTQQVCEDDKLNLKKAFNRGQDFDKKAGALLERYKKQAEQTGFKNIKSKVSNIPDYFKSKKNLLDFLNKAPTIPGFGKANDYEILERFIKDNRVEKGIKSNTARFFLEMSKE